MKVLLAAFALTLALSARAQEVRSLAMDGRQYVVNGLPSLMLGLGTYKDVLMHPQDPDFVVKVFRNNMAPSLPEQRAELASVRQLQPAGAVPTLIGSGVAQVAGETRGYLVQERVHGLDLTRPTAIKLQETRALFSKLKKARVELVDVESLEKLRSNIMVGETKSGGFGAYLVDADIKPTDKTSAQLGAFYDGLLRRLSQP